MFFTHQKTPEQFVLNFMQSFHGESSCYILLSSLKLQRLIYLSFSKHFYLMQHKNVMLHF